MTRLAKAALSACDLTSVRKLDFDFEHFQVPVPIQVDMDIFDVNFDVLADHSNQVALKVLQIIGLSSVAAAALVCKDQLQSLFGNVGSLFLFSQQKR